MSDAIFGKGTQLQYETAPGSDTWQTVKEVQSIGGPGTQADEVDVTNHDSVGDYREKIRGLIDGGDLTATINFQPDDASHQALISDLNAGTRRQWRLRWSQMTTVYRLRFPEGFVKSLPLENPTDAQLTANLTVTVSGQPVLDNE